MNIDLDITLLGGQAFNWEYINNSYYGFTQNGVIKVYEKDGYIHSEQKNENIDINKYLGLDLDHKYIRSVINKDKYIHNAITNINNLTILKQDFIQTTISYILATNKNIPAIRESIRLLSKRYGKKILIDDLEMYTFPMLEDIANVSIEDLKTTKIGYRAIYLNKSSQLLLKNNLQNHITKRDKENIREELLKLPGVGPKVADCILLYSLGYLETVPIDIWMYNIAKEIYKIPFTRYTDISKWYTNYFGEYAGIAAQYLFEYYRKNPLA